MNIAIKIGASIVGVVFAALVYTVVFSIITLWIHNAKALGWPALRVDPLYWVFGILVIGGLTWYCWRWINTP